MPSLEEIKKQISTSGYRKKFIETSKEIDELPNILQENEGVEVIAYGQIKGEHLGGILVATPNRLIFVGKVYFGKTKGELKVESYPYDKITSIQYKTGAMGEIALLISGKEVNISCDYNKVRIFAELVHAKLGNTTPLIDGNPHAGKPFPKWQAMFWLLLAVAFFYIQYDKGKSKSDDRSKATENAPRISQREQSIDITARKQLKDKGFNVDDCRRESARIAKCKIVAYGPSARSTNSYSIDGMELTATAYKSESDNSVSLTDPIINAPKFITNLMPSEITIIMPEGTDTVYIGYRLY